MLVAKALQSFKKALFCKVQQEVCWGDAVGALAREASSQQQLHLERDIFNYGQSLDLALHIYALEQPKLSPQAAADLVQACLSYKRLPFLFEVAEACLAQQESAQFFKAVLKACSLAKNATLAVQVVARMAKDLQENLNAEDHLNPAFEACIKSHKTEKIVEI